jgi:hypothetical protein
MNELPVKWADVVDGRVILDGKPIFGHIEGAIAYHLYDQDGELSAIVKVRLGVHTKVLENA